MSVFTDKIEIYSLQQQSEAIGAWRKNKENKVINEWLATQDIAEYTAVKKWLAAAPKDRMENVKSALGVFQEKYNYIGRTQVQKLETFLGHYEGASEMRFEVFAELISNSSKANNSDCVIFFQTARNAYLRSLLIDWRDEKLQLFNFVENRKFNIYFHNLENSKKRQYLTLIKPYVEQIQNDIFKKLVLEYVNNELKSCQDFDSAADKKTSLETKINVESYNLTLTPAIKESLTYIEKGLKTFFRIWAENKGMRPIKKVKATKAMPEHTILQQLDRIRIEDHAAQVIVQQLLLNKPISSEQFKDFQDYTKFVSVKNSKGKMFTALQTVMNHLQPVKHDSACDSTPSALVFQGVGAGAGLSSSQQVTAAIKEELKSEFAIGKPAGT